MVCNNCKKEISKHEATIYYLEVNKSDIIAVDYDGILCKGCINARHIAAKKLYT